MAYSKEDFVKFWGNNGYKEIFTPYKEYGHNYETLYKTLVKPFENNNHLCLEIGCGGGVWTNKLINSFKQVYAIDVIPRSPLLHSNIIYYELNSFDYFCSNIDNNSIDFVFSFGCFCHLPNSALYEYIKNIYRVLKKNGNAVLMFADWDTHSIFKNILNKEEYKEKDNITWFYTNKEIIKGILNSNGIYEYKDMIPFFRDRIIHFKK